MQAGALEDIIKQSQLEIIELKHTVDELRYFPSSLTCHRKFFASVV